MKNIYAMITAFAFAALFGCASAPQNYGGSPATNIIVNVTCTDSGARFNGTITCDGQTERLVGIGQGSFPATGHAFACSFQKSDDAGKILLSVSEGGKNLGSSSTGGVSGGVRAELLRTPTEQQTLFTTF